MKALSIKEPWLSRIVSGEKTIETRTWKCPEKFMGEILLVGSKKPSGPYAGKAACIATIAECRPMTKRDEAQALCPVYPGAYSWFLTNIRPVKPVSIKGQLGIYQVDDSQIEILPENYQQLYEELLPAEDLFRTQVLGEYPPERKQ